MMLFICQVVPFYDTHKKTKNFSEDAGWSGVSVWFNRFPLILNPIGAWLIIMSFMSAYVIIVSCYCAIRTFADSWMVFGRRPSDLDRLRIHGNGFDWSVYRGVSMTSPNRFARWSHKQACSTHPSSELRENDRSDKRVKVQELRHKFK